MSWDAIVAVLCVGVLWFLFRAVGWWEWFWLGLAVYLGLFELTAKLVTGLTISQQFWAYSQNHPKTALTLGIIVALGGIGLAAHLLWKLPRG